ncbi:MAG: hypothetical protein OXN25_08795 [Candidatus Poribacteria bacterium]|nr:hypothetical protein [Candidatus Poribacteria bacterium]
MKISELTYQGSGLRFAALFFYSRQPSGREINGMNALGHSPSPKPFQRSVKKRGVW